MRLSTTLAASLFTTLVAAQVCVLEPRIGTVTECFPYNNDRLHILTLGPTPLVQSPVETGQPIVINIQAPVCYSCGCNGAGCHATTVYETTFLSLCTTAGLTSQVYTVTETYSGVSPTLQHQPPAVHTPGLPFGFTTTLKSCTVCNPPVTAVITHPVTTCPYVTGLSKPSPAPAGVPPYEICTTGDTIPGETGSFGPGLGDVGGSGSLGAGSWSDMGPEASSNGENMAGWSDGTGSSGSAGGNNNNNNNNAGGSSGGGSSLPPPAAPPSDTGSSPAWPGGEDTGGSSGWKSSLRPPPPPLPSDSGLSPAWPGGENMGDSGSSNSWSSKTGSPHGPESKPSESSCDSTAMSSSKTTSPGATTSSGTNSATSSTSTSTVTAAAPRSLAPFLEGILFGLLVAYTFILQ